MTALISDSVKPHFSKLVRDEMVEFNPAKLYSKNYELF